MSLNTITTEKTKEVIDAFLVSELNYNSSDIAKMSFNEKIIVLTDESSLQELENFITQ